MSGSIPAPAIAIDAPPATRRRNWWLRLTLAGLVVLVGLRLAWGCVAQRQFDRAARQLAPMPQPAPGDAPLLYSQALSELAAASGTTPLWPDVAATPSPYRFLCAAFRAEPIRWNQDKVRKHLAASASLLDAVHAARERPGRAWPTDPVVPGRSGYELRMALLHYPWAAAVVAHFANDDETALERFLDALALAERLPGEDIRLATASFAPAADNLLLYRFATELLPVMDVAPLVGEGSPPEPAWATTSPRWRRWAPSEQLATLRLRLLDERSVVERYSACVRCCETVVLRAANMRSPAPGALFPSILTVPRRTRGPAVQKILLQPLWQQDAAAILNYWRALEPLGVATHCPEVLPVSPRLRDPAAFLHSPERSNALAFGSFLVSDHFGTLALRRLLAVAVAAREFAAARGRALERLEELVPEYLPEVPLDPFAPAGEPLVLEESAGKMAVCARCPYPEWVQYGAACDSSGFSPGADFRVRLPILAAAPLEQATSDQKP